jgi:hypothetical protein
MRILLRFYVQLGRLEPGQRVVSLRFDSVLFDCLIFFGTESSRGDHREDHRESAKDRSTLQARMP